MSSNEGLIHDMQTFTPNNQTQWIQTLAISSGIQTKVSRVACSALLFLTYSLSLSMMMTLQLVLMGSFVLSDMAHPSEGLLDSVRV